MEYKFIYVDDTQDKIEQGTINGLEDGGELKITFEKPSDWETLINRIIEMIPNHDGIILDLRLNGTPYALNKYAQYRGSTLAQELRTLSKENQDKKDFPIILISADENIEKSFDQTSLDLFDLLVSKNSLGNSQIMSYGSFKDKLKWLSDGYKYLNEHGKTINEILDKSTLPVLDKRFLEVFSDKVNMPIHILARFITKQIVGKPGFLIDENYLSVRLGIDRSSENWDELINNFLPKFIKYSGAFSNYYSRWWMSLLEEFWIDKVSKEFNIRSTSSTKKVELLSTISGLKNLKPIQKASKSKSDAFWVVCKSTNAAIDTIDGFVIAGQDGKYSWQENEYISIEEALRPTQNFTVSPIERPRLKKLMDFFESHEQRARK